MPEWFDVFWDESPGGNVGHVMEHGVSPDEVEEVLRECFDDRERSRSASEHWIVFGSTSTGRFLLVAFEYHRDLSLVVPVTAYEPTED